MIPMVWRRAFRQPRQRRPSPGPVLLSGNRPIPVRQAVYRSALSYMTAAPGIAFGFSRITIDAILKPQPLLAELPPMNTKPAFTKYAWFVLGWNILVILWGVFLRA